ncbi:DUF222 domain-containing protein [Corynebacterium variabile]|uniref:DUF222 domain-containing protein n=1 Tax=Corynebacterium variabile TaxID=1727 RepID=UPI003FD20E9D
MQYPAEADSRNPAQRRHDALFAAIAAGYGRGKELAPGRGTTTIVAAVTLEQLAARTGTAVTDTGVRMPVDQLVETCDARDLFLQVMDFHGRSLFLGRSRRLGSVDQYLVLVGEEGASSALIHGDGRPSHRRKGVPTGCCGSLRNRWTPPGHRRSPCTRRVGRHRGRSYADSHGHCWAY